MKKGPKFKNTPEVMKSYAVIDEKTKCWLWPRSKDRDGYGRFVYQGKDKPVHRLAFEFWVEPIKPGYVIMHTCDNPSCYNPDHLKQGTIQDNIRDCVRKGRKPKREKNGNATLTNFQVGKIRQLSYYDKISNEELSKMFNVSRRQIFNIIHNIHWIEETN